MSRCHDRDLTQDVVHEVLAHLAHEGQGDVPQVRGSPAQLGLHLPPDVDEGLEVGMSVASVALRGEPTGVAQCWNADVVATAKRDLKPGDMLDGEGGYTVWGKLLPAETSFGMGGLPLGLAHDVKVTRLVAKGQSLSWGDVAIDTSTDAYKLRREMEELFSDSFGQARRKTA